MRLLRTSIVVTATFAHLSWASPAVATHEQLNVDIQYGRPVLTQPDPGPATAGSGKNGGEPASRSHSDARATTARASARSTATRRGSTPRIATHSPNKAFSYARDVDDASDSPATPGWTSREALIVGSAIVVGLIATAAVVRRRRRQTAAGR